MIQHLIQARQILGQLGIGGQPPQHPVVETDDRLGPLAALGLVLAALANLAADLIEGLLMEGHVEIVHGFIDRLLSVGDRL